MLVARRTRHHGHLVIDFHGRKGYEAYVEGRVLELGVRHSRERLDEE